MSHDTFDGKIVALPHRSITEETCRHYGYACARRGDDVIEIATYLRDGVPIGQKFRGPDKRFWGSGDMRNAPLWGQWLWPSGGRKLIIAEGEIDCMSISQIQDNKWPVVSVPNGAAGAAASIRRELEWVSSFDEVILAFDMDEPGRKAALEVAQLLPPGKARIASLSRKDANEMLQHGEVEELRRAVVWNAAPYRPDGILHVSDIVVDANPDCDIWEFPWPDLTEFLVGQRSGEITLWTSGTGSGKSTLVRELVLHHLTHDRSVGMVMLEESPDETLDDLISLRINRPVRRIRAQRALGTLRRNRGGTPVDIQLDYTEEQYAAARGWLSGKGLWIYDHIGANDYRNIASRIEYMAAGLGCKVVILDHITAAVAGMLGQESDSERLVIDDLMKTLRSIVERTGVHLDVISQLRKTNGRQYEEGGRIGLQDLRGSGSLGSVPNTVIAMERDRQSPDRNIAETSVLRVLKNRFTGRVGCASALRYDPPQGRLIEVPFALSDDGEPVFGNPGTLRVPTSGETSPNELI